VAIEWTHVELTNPSAKTMVLANCDGFLFGTVRKHSGAGGLCIVGFAAGQDT
jgi:hypothetical protein